MTNIPFPNPHDSDALNDYLDSLAAGKQATPGNEVEQAAREFHHLASRAKLEALSQANPNTNTGDGTMHTASLTAPVSNRTRAREARQHQKPDRANTWLTAVIVAGLLISLLATSWLNREPSNPHENLALAPGTAEALPDDTLELTPESPESTLWARDFNPADCAETSGLTNVPIDYASMPKSDPQGYGIIGPANADDAKAASEQYRAMRACTILTDAWAYWTDARINEHTRVLDDHSYQELAELQEYYAGIYPEQFILVASDLTVSPEIEAEWAAREQTGDVGQPIPLEARLNPAWAVELNDGRIAFPATNTYAAEDPAIVANGFPVEPASTVVMIFAQEDGAWKYDDSLALCLVNCSSGVGNPLDVAEATWAKDLQNQTCSGQPLSGSSQSFGNNDLEATDYASRQYDPVGPADPEAASKAGKVVTKWNACSTHEGSTSMEAQSYMSPLGFLNSHYLMNEGTGDPFVSAPYMQQWETGSTDLATGTTLWNQITVLDEPVRSSWGNMTWEPVLSGDMPNTGSVRVMQQGFDPATAVELSDGRINVFSVMTISIEDRGAITYEGNRPLQQVAGVTLKEFEGQWLVDELIMAPNGVFAHTESDAWWWDPSFTTPGDATPDDLDATPAS